MGQLIEQMAIDFELEAVKKGREIRTSTPEESIMMHGDTEKIVRVFHNLLSNALKYGKGGTLICINAVRSEDTVTVTVSNNGETLPEEAIEQLFERFYRAEASRSQETAGTGLGLAIAQSIVELHQGKISAEVKDGWTVFTVVLPLENEESQKQ